MDDFKVVYFPVNESDEAKLGATIKGTSSKYKEAHEKVSNMFTKKGAEFTVNKRKVKVLDNPKEKGCAKADIEVTTLKGERGLSV